MKKYILIFVTIIVALAACKKNDDYLFNESPDDRLSEALTRYQKMLADDAPNGWKAVVTSASGVVHSFYFQFDNNNRIKSVADMNTTSASVVKESSYRLKALQTPCLIFDSYTYLHMMADPDETVAGGTRGSGFLSDFEFAFDDSTIKGDTLKMAGRFNNTNLVMVKATKAEADAYKSGQLKNMMDQLLNINKILTYFKRMSLSDAEYEVNFNFLTQVVTFSWPDANGVIQIFSSGYYVTPNTVILVTPFKGINEFDNISWDDINNKLLLTINGKQAAIRGAIAPLKIDMAAAQNWYTQMSLNFNGCWVSDKAFHVNGVDDYCKFGSISSTAQLWYAGASVFGGTNEGIITFNSSLYAPYCYSKTPFTVNAGIARFTLNANNGTFSGNALANAMTSARNIMYKGATVGSFEDWYFIPTSSTGKSYDMVRASDALAWISWRPR